MKAANLRNISYLPSEVMERHNLRGTWRKTYRIKEKVALLHRDPDKRLRNKSKSGHEERVLATQKCLVGGGNGRAFDARYLLDF